MNSKRMFALFLALALPAAIFGKPPAEVKSSPLKNAVILVIRHAEKPAAGQSLSAAGEARARAYADYFKHFSIGRQSCPPDYLFATADSTNSHRPRLTLEPLARDLGLKLDRRFNNNQFQALARELQTRPFGTNILICWHHGKIPQLLRALGADPQKLLPKGEWPDAVFGWLIQLRYDEHGRLFASERLNVNLSPADAPSPARSPP